MTMLRAAVLAAVLTCPTLAAADGRRPFHDEAGLLVGIGIFADYLGASALLDLIAPSTPETCACGTCDRAPCVDIGMRYSAERLSTPPWYR